MKQKHVRKLNKKYILSLFFIFSLLALIPVVSFADGDTEDAYGSHIGGLTIQQYNATTAQWFNVYQKYHSNYGGAQYEEDELVRIYANLDIRFSLDCLLNNTWAENKTYFETIVGLGLNITGDIEYLNPVLVDDFSYNLNGFYHYTFTTTDTDTFTDSDQEAYAEFIDYYYNGSSWVIIDTWSLTFVSFEEVGENTIFLETFEDQIFNYATHSDNFNAVGMIHANASLNSNYGLYFQSRADDFDWFGWEFNNYPLSAMYDYPEDVGIYFSFQYHNVTEPYGGAHSDYNSGLTEHTFTLDYQPYWTYYAGIAVTQLNITYYNMSIFLQDYSPDETFYFNGSTLLEFATWYSIGFQWDSTTRTFRLTIDGDTEVYITPDDYDSLFTDSNLFSQPVRNIRFDGLHEAEQGWRATYFENINFTPQSIGTPTDYSMFFIGLAGVIIMIGSPSWFAIKLREGLRSADEIVRRFIFALLLFVVGYCLILVWLGEFL